MSERHPQRKEKRSQKIIGAIIKANDLHEKLDQLDETARQFGIREFGLARNEAEVGIRGLVEAYYAAREEELADEQAQLPGTSPLAKVIGRPPKEDKK